MTQEKALHRLNEEIGQFEKSMEDMKLLRSVSKDLKNFRKMIKLKKYD